MKKKREEVKRLIKKSYIAAIENSAGTKIFKNFYAVVDEKKTDVAKNGELSCAYFVSAILTIFGLISRIHLTVEETIKDLKKSNWTKIKKPRVGSVIIWGRQKNTEDKHRHIGFYVGNKMAISNSTSHRYPVRHNWTFAGQRKVEMIFWSDKIK